MPMTARQVLLEGGSHGRSKDLICMSARSGEKKLQRLVISLLNVLSTAESRHQMVYLFIPAMTNNGLCVVCF